MNYYYGIVLMISTHLLANVTNANHGISIITVGDDNQCDHTNLQMAISAAANDTVDEIRVVSNTYAENLLIDDLDIVLRGGYANCTDALDGISDGQKAIVQAVDTAPTLVLTSSGNKNNVLIENMVFTNGTGGGFPFSFFTGGGITTFAANLDLTLVDVVIKNNTGTAGGGIAALGGDTDIIGINLQISDNFATQGGGLFCKGGDTSITLLDTGVLSSGIYNNDAINGGGVFITEDCSFTSYSGGDVTLDDKRGISFNKAIKHGGGIFVTGGGTLSLIGSERCDNNGNCLGNNDFPININNNSADSNNDGIGYGGAFFLEGVSIDVAVVAYQINENKASLGGAIYAVNGAFAKFSFAQGDCWNPSSCNQFTGNKAVNGGVFYSANNSRIILSHSYIRNNQANEGVVGFVRSGGTVSLSKSIISQNGLTDDNEFDNRELFLILGDDSDLWLHANTIVDNTLSNTIIQNGLLSNNSGFVILSNSIVNNPGIDIYTSNSTKGYAASCLVVDNDSTISGQNIIVADPVFVDRVAGDFHIDISSPAVDMCPAADKLFSVSKALFFDLDIDLEPRGFDYPGIVNVQGPYDAGADEINDRIFADSFEFLELSLNN